ncbi:MAG: HNH endonuclease signature motif containing protein [Planctomycetota bacterium]
MTLTFEELPLQEAIRKVFEHPDFVRSEVLLITDKGREWILQNVIVNLPIDLVGDYRFEHILLSVNQFRKLGKEALRKRLIVLEHARNMKDPCCFYQGKVGSVCSREVDLDRVKPGKRGGRYSIDNTVLSCARHNRSRGCKEVVAYWEQ